MIIERINKILSNIPWKDLFDKINYFEQNFDKQFKAIENIITKYPDLKWDILFAVTQNALISYQLSGTWENRWIEFSNYLIDNIDKFLSNNFLFWQKFLNNCRNNRRFVNNKLVRIKKSLVLYEVIKNNWKNLYENMTELNNILASSMNQKLYSKTIVFAVKMFWYWSRIKYKFIPYPFEIDIPVDSRITKIYLQEIKKDKVKSSEIITYFRQLSEDLWIPPLHLDSILRVNSINNEIK